MALRLCLHLTTLEVSPSFKVVPSWVPPGAHPSFGHKVQRGDDDLCHLSDGRAQSPKESQTTGPFPASACSVLIRAGQGLWRLDTSKQRAFPVPVEAVCDTVTHISQLVKGGNDKGI